MNFDQLETAVQQDVAKAAELFHQAQSFTDPRTRGYRPPSQGQSGAPRPTPNQGGSGGYSIKFAGFDGCSRSHNWANLRAAGVPVEYINVNLNHAPVSDRPPFPEMPTRDANEAFRLADRYGLGPDARMVALVGPNGRTIAHLDSYSPDFVERVRDYTGNSRGAGQPAQPPARRF